MLFSLSSENVKDLLGTSATLTTVLQFLTGCLICNSYIKKKSTGETSSLPFTSGLLSCSLWLRYGVLINENTVIFVNAVGVFLFSLYCISYYIFTVNKRRMAHQLLLVLLMITFSFVYSKFEPDDLQASRLIGLLCCSVGVFFFASPLIKLKHVIVSKNTEVLPRPIIIASFFVTLQWFIYGYLIDDSFIQIPNFLGCILSAIQLALFVIYPSKEVKYKQLTSEDVLPF